MKTKLEMAHEWAMKIIEGNVRAADASDLLEQAWQYADAMQAEAEKRKPNPVLPALHQTFIDGIEQPRYAEEWQPDWSQAPEWANWWAIGSLTKQGIWSEAKPNSVKINGADYWEVTSPIGDEHLSVAPSFNYQGDWRDSPRKRPQ